MPLYEAVHRAATTLLDNGAVIEGMKSLGHRDLPYKRIDKQTKEPVYTSNYFLINAHMSLDAHKRTKTILRNDLDMVHVDMVSETDLCAAPFECNLDELLKPAPERQAVKDLRDNQKMGHFTRQMIFKRTEKEWKSIPKSYPIAPPRS
ncbi:hypothetical protein QR680_009418 [Steinernema hermaphroditum]|uniref:Uncharacterized protein n=1 Tax=Steinernema hermaphroditum TaxID=289476 RepID=A0AA39M9U3_9BILA|nr:hypothetical protein QR680_009418 [Steinernema hermaphroditum]